MMRLLTQQGQMIAEHVEVAETMLSRMQGLLGRRELPARHALWIHRCNSIHTFFMKFSIDVLFVDRALAVVGIRRDLPAWRITFPIQNADSVFELPAGSLSDVVKIGDRLQLVELGSVDSQATIAEGI
jgi:uncharacterized membrane protein (UPF0127 family)